MKKLKPNKIMKGDVKMRNLLKHIQRLFRDEAGAVGVKQIAIAVASVVVIGAVAAVLISENFLSRAITDVWDWLWLQIQTILGQQI